MLNNSFWYLCTLHIILQLNRWSFFKTYSACALFSNTFVVGLPLLSSSSTDSLPLVYSPCNQKVARDTADSPNTFKILHMFLLHYNQIAHKIELQHIDLNFFQYNYYTKSQAILTQNMAVLTRVNQLSWNLVCRLKRDHITTSQEFWEDRTKSLNFRSVVSKLVGHTVYI